MAVYGRCQQLNAREGRSASGCSRVSRLLGGRPSKSVRALDLDLLGACPFRCENARKGVLTFVGLPLFLSSESGLFNGLYGQKRRNFFSTPFRGLSRAETAPWFWACVSTGLLIVQA